MKSRRAIRNITPAVWCLLLTLLFGWGFSVSGQVSKSDGPAPRTGEHKFTVDAETHQLKSALMGREMPYRIIFPPDYRSKQSASRRYTTIFLLHGLGGHFDNWTEKTALGEYSHNRAFIIVMPEGGDGWYTDSVSVPADKYESYVMQELIPEIDAKYRTLADRGHRAIAGLSMGGYGALKFGLKYTDKFAIAGSFSGALDGPLRGQEHQFLRPSIMSVFGPENSQTRKDNDIFRIVREIPAEKIKDLPFLYIDCGTEDWLLQPNRDFADLLLKQKIPHEYRQLPGRHDWNFWGAEVQQFLDVAGKKLGAATPTQKK
jgi:S-formylglutathione hydrolase FrmB